MPVRRGAISRADDTTEICPDCGTEEALREFLGLRRLPPSEWPVEAPERRAP
jgi:hypothetical protein